MKTSLQKGLSLIEILLVLGIFGILVFIVLAAAGSSVREKAERNKFLQFSRSIHNWLVTEGVGVWSFDEGSGTTAGDLSTNNQSLSVGSNAWAEGVLKTGLVFDGSLTSLNIPQPLFATTPEKLAFSAWVKPAASSGDQVIFYNATNGEFLIGINTNKEPYASYRLSNGSWQTLNSDQPLTVGTWGHIAFRWDSIANETSLYVNTIQRASGQPGIGAQLYNGSGDATIGSQNGTNFFNGTLDEVEVYRDAF